MVVSKYLKEDNIIVYLVTRYGKRYERADNVHVNFSCPVKIYSKSNAVSFENCVMLGFQSFLGGIFFGR